MTRFKQTGVIMQSVCRRQEKLLTGGFGISTGKGGYGLRTEEKQK